MKDKCVNKLSCRSAVWAGLTKQSTNSSRNGLLIRASKLQVNLQVHLSVHINVLCLTVILTVKLFIIYILDSSFQALSNHW
jgi:hypothetical protein